MRDTFIDISTNKAFDGNPPYIFRFDGGQSVGLNYIKKICLISDSSNINIHTKSDQNIFKVLKMENTPQVYPGDFQTTVMNLQKYVELDTLIAENNTWDCNGFPFILHENSDPEFYVYMIYILGRADEPGQYTDDIYINGVNYIISADFYIENEVLKENLKNFESKLPESIQKAIYDSNVHEELTDNILINRKNKELLMNYLDIMGSKGSYESILDSINWFEWGELLRIEEYWKRYVNDELNYDYFATELNHQLTPEDIHQLSNHVKSTFIGIYCALKKYQAVRGRIAYQDTFGRHSQPDTSWSDQYATHMQTPLDLYGQSEVESATILDPHQNIDPALNAEIGEEIPDELPGTMRGAGSPMIGGWALYTDPVTGEQTWTEITSGNISSLTGPNYTYWDIDFNYIYNEEMPNLLNITALWSEQDLSLKMSVLGSFFSSFFMPIQLDLIHSCIEYWTMAYGIKYIYSQERENYVCLDKIQGVDMIWESDGKIYPHPETQSFYNTLFRNYNTESVFGFDINVDEEDIERLTHIPGYNWEAHNKDILNYTYKGECCDVHFMGQIYSGSRKLPVNIYKQRLTWINDQGENGNIESNAVLEPIIEKIRDSIPEYQVGRYVKIDDVFIEIDNDHKSEYIRKRLDTYSERVIYNLDFHIGFKKQGNYILYFEFYDTNNVIYTKKLTISISEYISDQINVMKLVPTDKDWDNIGENLNLYQFADIDSLEEEFDDSDIFLQSHFMSAQSMTPTSAGTTHTLNVIVEEDYEFDNDPDNGYNTPLSHWTDGENDVYPSSGLIGSSFEGEVIRWIRDDDIARWRADSDLPQYWPSEWGAFSQQSSQEHDGDMIPISYTSSTLNNIIERLEEEFPDYWWSWDKLQISKRDSLEVKPNDINFDYIIEKIYPDEYPA